MTLLSWRRRKRLIHWLAGGRYVVVNKPALHFTQFLDTSVPARNTTSTYRLPEEIR